MNVAADTHDPRDALRARARLAEVAGLLAAAVSPALGTWGRIRGDAAADAIDAVHGEARLLDDGAFDVWLDRWHADALLWVPLAAGSSPDADQSLYLDDLRRLRDRVRWRREPSAWGQQPASATVRVVGTAQCWGTGANGSGEPSIVVRSSLVLVEHRLAESQVLGGHQVHELVGDELRIRSKIIVLPALRVGVRNPSFVM